MVKEKVKKNNLQWLKLKKKDKVTKIKFIFKLYFRDIWLKYNWIMYY